MVYMVVNGKVVVWEGWLVMFDLLFVIECYNVFVYVFVEVLC